MLFVTIRKWLLFMVCVLLPLAGSAVFGAEEVPKPVATVSQEVQASRAARLKADLRTALRHANQALRNATNAADTAGIAEASRQLALARSAMGNRFAAAEAWGSAEQAYRKLEFLPGVAEALTARALVAFERNPRVGGMLLDQLSDLSMKPTPHHAAMARTLNCAAAGTAGLWNEPLTRRLLQAARGHLQASLPNSLDLAAVDFNLGWIKTASLVELDGAAAAFTSALRVLTNQAPRSLATALTYHQMAELAELRGRPDEAKAMVAATRKVLESMDRAEVLRVDSLEAQLLVGADLGGTVPPSRYLAVAEITPTEKLDSEEDLSENSGGDTTNEKIFARLSKAIQAMAYDYYLGAIEVREGRQQNDDAADLATFLNKLFVGSEGQMDERMVREKIDVLVQAVASQPVLAMEPVHNPTLAPPKMPAMMHPDDEKPAKPQPQEEPKKKKKGGRFLGIVKAIGDAGKALGGIPGLPGEDAKDELEQAGRITETTDDLSTLGGFGGDMGKFMDQMAELGHDIMAAMVVSNWPSARRGIYDGRPGLAIMGGASDETAQLSAEWGRFMQTMMPELVPSIIAEMVNPTVQRQGRFDLLWQLIDDRRSVEQARRVAAHSYLRDKASSPQGQETIRRFRDDYSADEKVLVALLEKGIAEAFLWDTEVDAPAELPAARAALGGREQKVKEAFAASRLRTRAHQEATLQLDREKGGQPGSVITAFEACRILPEGTVWITLTMDNRGGSVFLLRGGQSPNRLLYHRHHLRETTIQRFHGLVSTTGTPEPTRLELGRTIFRELFPAEMCQAILSAKRVLISPEASLWDLPFAALVLDNSALPRYLGLEKPISYQVSFGAYQGTHQAHTATNSVAAVFGDVAFQRETGMAYDFTKYKYLKLTDLPGSRTEAEQVAALYQATPKLRRDVTKAAVCEAVANAQFVHVATHGLNLADYVNPRDLPSQFLRQPGFSGLWFAASPTGDALLQAWEIAAGLRADCELAVLSACETGRTKFMGRPPPEIPEALLSAGVKSVVASQWRVADESTAQLMPLFHKELKTGAGKDEALRRAMKALQQGSRTAHPYFWAPFLLFGDPDSKRWRTPS